MTCDTLVLDTHQSFPPLAKTQRGGGFGSVFGSSGFTKSSGTPLFVMGVGSGLIESSGMPALPTGARGAMGGAPLSSS